MYYLPEEFSELLKKGKKISRESCRERKKYYVLHLQNGEIKFYTGRMAKKIEKRELSPKKESFIIKDIIGSVASEGVAQGNVRIVNTQDQMRKMKNGEVLVSIMTTPRLLGAVKKAAAIVTDEGGITCHAAIISRELKIPCVIGTKIATKVLKDGDMVEVDATRGVVKKLG